MKHESSFNYSAKAQNCTGKRTLEKLFEAAVVGLPHKTLGEVGSAFIAVEEGFDEQGSGYVPFMSQPDEFNRSFRAHLERS